MTNVLGIAQHVTSALDQRRDRDMGLKIENSCFGFALDCASDLVFGNPVETLAFVYEILLSSLTPSGLFMGLSST